MKKEVDELGQAIEEGDKVHITEEVLDVVQVCIASFMKQTGSVYIG